MAMTVDFNVFVNVGRYWVENIRESNWKFYDFDKWVLDTYRVEIIQNQRDKVAYLYGEENDCLLFLLRWQ